MASWRDNYARYRSIFSRLIDLYRKKDNIMMFLELLLTLSTITIFTIFALKPTVITIIDLVKEIEAKKETISKMDTKIKNLVTAQTRLSQESQRLDLLNKAIPTEPLPAKAITQFVGLANEKNIHLKTAGTGDITLKGETETKTSSKGEGDKDKIENASVLDLNLSLEGDFQQLLDFLKSAEKMLRPFKIDNLSLIKNEKEGEVNIIKLTINGRIPYMRQITDNNSK